MNHTYTPVIWIHLVTALTVLALGAGVFLARKGTFAHRVAGRSWALLMLVTAMSTFWIRSSGSFSWIHLISIGTLAGLAMTVYYAMSHRIQAHRRTVISLYIGSLVIAGLFALLPQRLLGRALWSALGVI